MVKEVQKHSVHTLVFRSLKRTRDMFVAGNGKPVPLDEGSHKRKMATKLHNEYGPVLHMPTSKGNLEEKGPQNAADSYPHKRYPANQGQDVEPSPRLVLTQALHPQLFLMIRRHKATIFTDAKESSTVFQLQLIVQDILKRPPDEQRLYKDDQLLDDGKTLGECGFSSWTAGPQAPATVGLAFRADDAFEALCIEPFSSPLGLPD